MVELSGNLNPSPGQWQCQVVATEQQAIDRLGTGYRFTLTNEVNHNDGCPEGRYIILKRVRVILIF